MGFGLLVFQKKRNNKKKKKPHLVVKVPLQHESLSQPEVPPQHITTLFLIFEFLLSKQHSQPNTAPHTSTDRNQTLNSRLLQMMKLSLPRRNPDLCNKSS